MSDNQLPAPAGPPPVRVPDPGSGTDPVLAPGYQAALLPAPALARPQWRAVQPNGRRLPPVRQLGVVIAQASAIARDHGQSWIVGPAEQTVHISHTGGTYCLATGPAPSRWVGTVRAVLDRAARPVATPHPPGHQA